jgi:hypothetical protein
VTVTDPRSWFYGEQGIVEDWELALLGAERVYSVSFDGRDSVPFTVDQLDFTEEAPRQ